MNKKLPPLFLLSTLSFLLFAPFCFLLFGQTQRNPKPSGFVNDPIVGTQYKAGLVTNGQSGVVLSGIFNGGTNSGTTGITNNQSTLVTLKGGLQVTSTAGIVAASNDDSLSEAISVGGSTNYGDLGYAGVTNAYLPGAGKGDFILRNRNPGGRIIIGNGAAGNTNSQAAIIVGSDNHVRFHHQTTVDGDLVLVDTNPNVTVFSCYGGVASNLLWLINSDGQYSIGNAINAGKFLDTSLILTLDIANRIAYDSAGTASIDWNSHKLEATGPVLVFDWSTTNLTAMPGSRFAGNGAGLTNLPAGASSTTITNLTNSAIFDLATGTQIIDVSGKALYDVSGILALSWTANAVNINSGHDLQVSNGLFSGNVTAKEFFGNGAGLTNLPAGASSTTITNLTNSAIFNLASGKKVLDTDNYKMLDSVGATAVNSDIHQLSAGTAVFDFSTTNLTAMLGSRFTGDGTGLSNVTASSSLPAGVLTNNDTKGWTNNLASGYGLVVSNILLKPNGAIFSTNYNNSGQLVISNGSIYIGLSSGGTPNISLNNGANGVGLTLNSLGNTAFSITAPATFGYNASQAYLFNASRKLWIGADGGPANGTQMITGSAVGDAAIVYVGALNFSGNNGTSITASMANTGAFTATSFTGNASGLTNFINAIQNGTTNVTTLTSFVATFTHAFPDTNYTALATGNGFALAGEYVTFKTTTNVTYNMTVASGVIDWIAIHQ